MRRSPHISERALRSTAAQQGGYFTAAEARRAGYGYRLQHFHRTRGNWMTIGRGIYRYPDYPDSLHEDLVRWALWSRGRKGQTQAVVSHDTALALHEMGDVMPGVVHLTVPPGFRKPAAGNCELHRGRLGPDDVEERPGFLVTTPLCTLLDVAVSALSPEHLAAAVRSALDRGLVRRARIEAAQVSSKGRQRLSDALRASEPNRLTRPAGAYDSASALRQALEDRLKRRALEKGDDLARLRRLVAFDRVLARLFVHGADAPWLVKGGFGLELRYRLQARTTKDLDLALTSPRLIAGNAASLREALQGAVDTEIRDGFVVIVGMPTKDLEGPPEGGARFPVEVRLAGRVFTTFHVDVGAGDPVLELPDWITCEEYFSFAGIPPARAAVIPLAQQFAEKVHAWSRPRGQSANTRVKDLADLVLVVGTAGLEPRRVAACVKATFARYATHPIPHELPVPPPAWAEPYAALARDLGRTERTLENARSAVAAFWSQVLRELSRAG